MLLPMSSEDSICQKLQRSQFFFHFNRFLNPCENVANASIYDFDYLYIYILQYTLPVTVLFGKNTQVATPISVDF